MNSNPTTLSVDERIDEIIEYWDFSPLQDEDERIKRLKTEFLSLIKEICEEVTPNRCTATRGNTQNPNNPMYSTKYAKGWNDCILEQRTKLNKILGEK